MPSFRKKPVVIEAFKYIHGMAPEQQPEWFLKAMQANICFPDYQNMSVKIETLEGTMTANNCDYIIKGVKGEIYPCKEDIFLATYMPVDIDTTTFNVHHVQDVYKFQTEVLGNEFPDSPILLDGAMRYETFTCLDEELKELANARTLPDQADAIVDLIYFAYGALHRMGVDTERVWTEVQRANMSKVRGKTKRMQENDAAKPEDWKEPDHSWLVVEKTGLTSVQD